MRHLDPYPESHREIQKNRGAGALREVQVALGVRLPLILHGIGTDDEPPNFPFPGDPHTDLPEGEFRENMVLAVECYAGKVGMQDGVKLEDEVWVNADGAAVISLYPYEAKLLG
jgi:Xaa-Pro aminopeptidase